MATLKQAELEAAYETPIEQYAREGALMQGCLWESKYQMKGKTIVKDAAGNPILLLKCGKLCNPGKKYCPKHLAMEAAKEKA
jgi:hypothetical protein